MAGNWKSLEMGHEAARFLFEETQTINRLNIYKYLMFRVGFRKKSETHAETGYTL